MSILSSKIINNINFEEIIKQELFNNKGQIYNHFLYILESSIGKVGKTSALNAILKEVSIKGEYKIIELSKKIGISSQLIGKELQKLKNISILYQDIEKNIKFRDYLFRFFCYYYYSSFETYQIDSDKFYIDKIEELSNKLSKVSSELGKTKEFELYYEIKENQGSQWNGLKLPLFRIIKKNYFTQIGNEIDLYSETIRGKKWIFELKYKTKQIGNKEIEQFISKMKADKYVFISKSGYCEKIDVNYKNNKDLYMIEIK